jgi:hypothetical protein
MYEVSHRETSLVLDEPEQNTKEADSMTEIHESNVIDSNVASDSDTKKIIIIGSGSYQICPASGPRY